jgi:hypothetical protein
MFAAGRGAPARASSRLGSPGAGILRARAPAARPRQSKLCSRTPAGWSRCGLCPLVAGQRHERSVAFHSKKSTPAPVKEHQLRPGLIDATITVPLLEPTEPSAYYDISMARLWLPQYIGRSFSFPGCAKLFYFPPPRLENRLTLSVDSPSKRLRGKPRVAR